jgi:hypothetical protein
VAVSISGAGSSREMPSFENIEEANKVHEPSALEVNHSRGLFLGVMNSVRILEKIREQNNLLDTSGTFIALHNKSNQ